MNEDHLWLHQQHDHLAEEIQRCRLFFEELQGYRREIAAVWNDSCANELNRRFLNPMSVEAAASLECMRLQIEALEICSDLLVEAYGSFLTASEASVTVQGHIDESLAIFRTIESFLNQAISEMRASDVYANRAEQLIANAEGAGNSAQSESSYLG